MNLLQKSLIAVATGSLLTVSAQAAINFTDGYGGQPYIGAKVGQYDTNDKDADDAITYGIYGGYKFTPNIGVEVEYLGTSTEDAYSNATSSSEYSGKVYGLYGTYDYMFPNMSGLYAKGRLGFAKNTFDIDVKDKVTNQSASDSLSDTGIAGGIGLGYAISPMASVEGMYNYYPSIDGDKYDAKDLDVRGFTLGAHVKF